ncbi:MAG TPA: tetratricopeptide repeat protein [Casimicrobiaceae bacterium]|nr:tetratricopeptide repeat protein [Casimicrobiaceae bacterium]
MKPSARIRSLVVFAFTLLLGGPCMASLDDGLDALRRGDFAAAAKILRPLAEHGNAEAQYRIGLMYEFGKGYPQDKAQGVAWFRKSAANGSASAQQELGVIYATGDGVPQDDAQAVAWFRSAAGQGNASAQYNYGLMLAKGAGIRHDDKQAIEWFRKAAAQGFALAQFKLGVAYENGQGVAQDPLLACASYAIAARSGNPEYVEHRDAMAARLTPAQAQQALAVANAWKVGQPMPAGVEGVRGTSAAWGATAAAHADKCSASGAMEGERFTASHCAIALYGDQHSVAIWFNADPITPDEVAAFEVSSYAADNKGGKPRTMLQVMFCPGGGREHASAGAVKSIDLNTNNAKPMVPGVQWVLAAPAELKIEKLSGEVKPGGVLAGHLTGARGKTTFTLDFDLALPARDASAGMNCGV